MRFVLDIDPPRTTAQQKRTTYRNGRPQYYDGARLKQARSTLQAALYPHKPKGEPLQGPVRVLIHSVYGTPDKKKWGKWKITRPDTDNSEKALKDEMTKLGFWKDDALICDSHEIKSWAEHGCIIIEIEELGELCEYEV